MVYYDTKQSGERIREMRRKRGYTQEEMAEILGVSVDTVQRVERGASGARVDMLVMLAAKLDVSLDWLVMGRDTESEKKKELEQTAVVIGQMVQAYLEGGSQKTA